MNHIIYQIKDCYFNKNLMFILLLLISLLIIQPLSAQQEIFNSAKDASGKSLALAKSDYRTKQILDQMDKYDVKEYILDLNVSNSSSMISGNATIVTEVKDATIDSFIIELINLHIPFNLVINTTGVRHCFKILYPNLFILRFNNSPLQSLMM